MSHQIGYKGRRPQATNPVSVPAHQPMDRPEALDHIIHVGQLVGGPITIRPAGDGYDAVLPVETLGAMAKSLQILGVRNAVLCAAIALLDQRNHDLRIEALRQHFAPLLSL